MLGASAVPGLALAAAAAAGRPMLYRAGCAGCAGIGMHRAPALAFHVSHAGDVDGGVLVAVAPVAVVGGCRIGDATIVTPLSDSI